MFFTCPKCNTVYDVPAEQVDTARQLRCAMCGHLWEPGAETEDVEEEKNETEHSFPTDGDEADDLPVFFKHGVYRYRDLRFFLSPAEQDAAGIPIAQPRICGKGLSDHADFERGRSKPFCRRCERAGIPSLLLRQKRKGSNASRFPRSADVQSERRHARKAGSRTPPRAGGTRHFANQSVKALNL